MVKIFHVLVLYLASDAVIAQGMPAVDVSTGVESEGVDHQPVSVVKRRLLTHSSRTAFHSDSAPGGPDRSRVLLEKAFDEGNIWFSGIVTF